MEEMIGRKIRSLREQAGLTQEDVAEAMDVSRQAVSKWEANLSRPSAENLIRLARLFKVELTEIIGAPEEIEAAGEKGILEGEAEEKPEEKGENPPPKRRRWPWIAVLGLLVLVALFGSPLTAMLFMVNTQSDGPAVSTQVTVEEMETELPYSLALTSWDYYQFEPYTNYGSPADPSIVEAGLLFQHRFAYTNTTVVFYAERSSYQGEQGNEELYHLYAAYTEDDETYTIIARIAEDRPDFGAPALSAFEALGYTGCKVVTTEGMEKSTFFFALDEAGTPCLVYMTPGETVEWDIDGDGEQEIAFLNHPESILFIDREVEDCTAYKLGQELPEGGELTVEKGAFQLHVPGQGGRSFVYFWNGELLPVRYDDTGFEIRRIDPEVADTVITFLALDWSDGVSPNMPYGSYGGVGSGMPSHRELAYLGLQTLYDLTGQTVERCYAAATEYGVTFSMDRNLDHHSFFSFDRTDEWFGDLNVVGGISHIAWQGEHTEWSPILPVEAGDARWVYDHVPLLQQGRIAETSFGLGNDVRLHLEDDRFYEVSFDGPGGLPTRIQGIYPAGFEH